MFVCVNARVCASPSASLQYGLTASERDVVDALAVNCAVAVFDCVVKL